MRKVRQALVLAAGRGSRLGSLTNDQPKPLLSLGSTSLLGRQLAQLAARGVEHVVVVVGYGKEAMCAEVSGAPQTLTVECIENPRFASTGSGRSLVLGAAGLRPGDPVVLTHGDIAFADDMLGACLSTPAGSTTVADPSWVTETDDEVLVWSHNGRALGIAKSKPTEPCDAQGEFVGISVFEADFWCDFVRFCEARTSADPELNYETPLLSDFLQSSPRTCAVCYSPDTPWINVNYPADLATARRFFASPSP